MDATTIIAAGVAAGTIYLFAAIGEIFAERAGILNLGVEGMMLIGAVAGFATVVATGNPWLGLLVAMLAGGLLSLLHGAMTIHFQADQVVSGLALTLVGVGLARVLGEGLSKAGGTSLLPTITVPGLSQVPVIGPIFFTNQSVLAYVGYLLVPTAWYWIHRTRPGLHLRAVGEYPTAADAMGVNVYRLRYGYVFLGGLLAGLAGATITLAIQPGWFGDLTVGGRGWIAVGLVIFARWDPFRVALGAYLFAAITRLLLDIQGPSDFLGIPNPFFFNQNLTYLLGMLPYVLVILAVIVGSREATRKRIGAPAALGVPYIRGERGV
ncbi:MAG: ABC transporter permease [Candidatus Limnocylindrales bacterium]